MKISIVLAALTGNFETDMNRASKTAQKRMREIEQNAVRVGKAVGAALAAGATVAAVAIKSAIDNADALDEMAQRTGIAVESLSRLQIAAKFGAVTMEDLQKAVGRLAVQQQNYAEGNEDTVSLFDALGVKAVDAEGKLRDTESVLIDLADAFAAMPDGPQKVALAMDLLGKSGQNMITFFNQGGQRIDDFMRRADALGVTLGGAAAAAAGDFNDQVELAKFAVQGLANQVMVDLIPDLLALTTEFNDTAAAGDGVSETASDIADGIRAVVDIAVRAKGVIEGLFLGVVSTFDFAAAAAAQVFGAAEDAAELLRRSEAARELSNDALDSAFGERAPGVNTPGGRIVFIDPPQSGPAGDPDRDRRLKDHANRREIAAAGAKAHAEAERAAARAMQEAERAAEELQRQLEENQRTRADFLTGLEDLEAQLKGPIAEAELEYKRRLAETNELLRNKIVTADEAARAEKLHGEQMARTRDELDPYGQGLRLLLADMQFEYDLLGKTNAQRVAELELRRLGIDLTTEQGEATRAMIEAEVEAYEQRARAIGAMDDFRSSFEDNVASVLDGTKSIKSAFSDLVDDIIAQLARMAAQNFAKSLFGAQGTDQTGSMGGWMSTLFSWFAGGSSGASPYGAGMAGFGGGRARGGPVSAGVPYLVGEYGPELIIPRGAGTVLTAGQTRKALGAGATVVQNFNMPGRYDLRTQAQVSADAGRSAQRALARGNA